MKTLLRERQLSLAEQSNFLLSGTAQASKNSIERSLTTDSAPKLAPVQNANSVLACPTASDVFSCQIDRHTSLTANNRLYSWYWCAKHRRVFDDRDVTDLGVTVVNNDECKVVTPPILTGGVHVNCDKLQGECEGARKATPSHTGA